MKTFYLVSDSTGELGERFLQAIMSQFPKDRIALRKFNFVKDQRDLRAAFAKMTARESVLFHTVVFRRLKTLIHRIAQRRGIPQFDLTGPAAEFVIEHLGMDPVWDVEVIHARNEEYDRRVRAIEFTIEHDDGAGLKDLREADVILVGPSRSSKTPTSMYLATKGYKVANIPLIRELGENEALAGLKKDRRVRAFTIRAPELIEIRSKRAAELGYRTAGYTDPAEVGREITWVRRVYARNGWRTIDVTDRAIEETAALIMKSLSLSETP